jgi:sugar phosphate isomerase/epimerase
MSTVQFGVAPLGFLELGPPALIEVASGAGFASVALRTRAAVPGGPEHRLRLGGDLLRETRRSIEQTGVAVLQVEQIGLGRDTEVASCREMLEAAAEIGATRVMCSGDDDDVGLVTDRFAALCELARGYGLSVDIEFMPFRALKTYEAASAVVSGAGQSNGFIALDALHLFRSGGDVETLARADPQQIGILQLCDAPLSPPAPQFLAEEAREKRLLPGRGELPLLDILRRVPPGCPITAEVPLASQFPDLAPEARAALIADAMRALLSRAAAPRGPGNVPG